MTGGVIYAWESFMPLTPAREKPINGRERITERRLVVFIATLLYNYSNILLFIVIKM